MWRKLRPLAQIDPYVIDESDGFLTIAVATTTRGLSMAVINSLAIVVAPPKITAEHHHSDPNRSWIDKDNDCQQFNGCEDPAIF